MRDLRRQTIYYYPKLQPRFFSFIQKKQSDCNSGFEEQISLGRRVVE